MEFGENYTFLQYFRTTNDLDKIGYLDICAFILEIATLGCITPVEDNRRQKTPLKFMLVKVYLCLFQPQIVNQDFSTYKILSQTICFFVYK